MDLRRYDTELTSLATGPFNKDFDGPPSGAEIRSQQNASLLGTALGKLFLLEGQPFELPDLESRPIVLAPGEGFVAVPTTVNQGLAMVASWVEI